MDCLKIPPPDGNSLHLEVGVADVNGEIHLSKIVVPKGTKIDNECLMNNNNLSCLNLSECDDISPPVFLNRRIYFPVNFEEQKIQQKE